MGGSKYPDGEINKETNGLFTRCTFCRKSECFLVGLMVERVILSVIEYALTYTLLYLNHN